MKGPSSSFHERIVSEERSGCFIRLGLRKVLVVSGCKAGFLLIVSRTGTWLFCICNFLCMCQSLHDSDSSVFVQVFNMRQWRVSHLFRITIIEVNPQLSPKRPHSPLPCPLPRPVKFSLGSSSRHSLGVEWRLRTVPSIVTPSGEL